MHSLLNWLGPASSIATVIALIVTLLYYLYRWPFHLKRPEGLAANLDLNRNPHRISLKWTPVHRASSYNLYRASAESGAVDLFLCPAHFHNDESLVTGETYDYYVVAVDQGHQSSDSAVVSINVPKTGEAPPRIDPGDPEAQWPVEDLRQLLPLIQGNKAVATILELTASKPNGPVSLSEVCERAEMTRRQVGTGLGTFTVLIKNSLGKTKWPFTYPPGQGGPYYKLSQEMAQRWRQAEAEARPQGSQDG